MKAILNPLESYIEIQAIEKNQRLNTLAKAEIISIYKTHGALLFRGFNINTDDFNAFSQQFCSSFFHHHSPMRNTLNTDKTIQTVDLSHDMFALHPELSQRPWHPDIAWFGSQETAPEGEGTFICDGIKVAESLPAELYKTLKEKNLKYISAVTRQQCEKILNRALPEDILDSNNDPNIPFNFSHINNTLHCNHITPVLTMPLFSNRYAFINFLLFARFSLGRKDFPLFSDNSQISDNLCEKINEVAMSVAVEIKWQKNDLIMLDNTRFMHGRPAVADPKKRRVYACFGYLSFHPNREQLSKIHPWRKTDAVFTIIN